MEVTAKVKTPVVQTTLESVTITLTPREAELLREVTEYPMAVSEHSNGRSVQKEIFQFLISLRLQLVKVNVPLI